MFGLLSIQREDQLIHNWFKSYNFYYKLRFVYTLLSRIVGNKRVKKKWFFSFYLVPLMLEDCRIGLGGRLVQRSNIVENLSHGVRGLKYSRIVRGTMIHRCVFYFMYLFFNIFTFISILKNKKTSANASNREKSNKSNSSPSERLHINLQLWHYKPNYPQLKKDKGKAQYKKFSKPRRSL